LAERIQEAEDRLMLDKGASYLVGSGLLGGVCMLATHDAELREIQDDINSVRQEVALLQEDLRELFREVRMVSDRVRKGRSEVSEESEDEGSDRVSETQLPSSDGPGSDVVMLS
jgi:predicted nuclease with TOPRIM domain